MPKGTPHSSRAAKIKFLLRHRKEWVGFPRSRFDLTQKQQMVVDRLVTKMKEADLFSPRTYPIDVRNAVITLIQDAKHGEKK